MLDNLVHTSWKFIDRISRQRLFSIILFALLSILLNSSTILINGVPNPRIHDEFSYLLGAETFAKGRITNPVHPLREFFDTFHVLNSPTRMSIYPPAQSLFLALGILMFGHPIAGVWISIALMCAIFTWMFYAWLPGRWAFIASFLVLNRLAFFTYWSHTYWGGTLAAIGGGLVFGGLRYLYRSPLKRYSAAIGLGLLILANSRPLEGFICGCIIIAAMIPFLTNVKSPFIKKLSIIAPMIILSILTVLLVAMYNKKVTGNPFSMPQRYAAAQLTSMPLFIWQKQSPEPVLESNWKADYINNFVLSHYNDKLKNYPSSILRTLNEHISFYTGFFLFSIIILTLPLCIKDRWFQLAFISIAIIVFFDVFLITIANQPHYLAPLSCLIFYCSAQSLRWISFFSFRSHFYGKNLVTYVIALLMVISTINCAINRGRPGLFRKNVIQKEWFSYRAAFEKRLTNTDGKHIVIVPYGPLHNIHNEWVYNKPDIDNSKIIWSRDLGPEKNRELFAYYPDRRFWVVLNENSSPELVPYTSELHLISND